MDSPMQSNQKKINIYIYADFIRRIQSGKQKGTNEKTPKGENIKKFLTENTKHITTHTALWKA